MKNFDQFLASALKSVQRELPDAEVKIQQVSKLNGSYVGISVRPQGAAATTYAFFDISSAFEDYQADPAKESDILSRIVADAKKVPATIPTFNVNSVMDYEWAKRHLTLRVIPVGRNREMLENLPHKTVGDIAVVYRVEIPHPEYRSATTLVTNQLLGQYGITLDQLHSDAVDTQMVNHPPVFKTISEVMGEMIGVMPLWLKVPAWIATVGGGTYGASVVLYPGFLDMAAKKMGGNFFVLPSSVHEVLLVPDNGHTKIRELEKMVRSTNKKAVAPKDWLSDHVYHYNASNRVFELAKAARRKKH